MPTKEEKELIDKGRIENIRTFYVGQKIRWFVFYPGRRDSRSVTGEVIKLNKFTLLVKTSEGEVRVDPDVFNIERVK